MSTKKQNPRKPAASRAPLPPRTPRIPRTPKISKSAARAEGAARTDRLRRAAFAEISERLAGEKQDHEAPSPKEVANSANLDAAATGKKGRAPKAPKAAQAAKKPKAKRVSALDAAAQVVAESKVPLRAKEMIAQMEARRLWTSPGGKTPAATLYAAIIREIAKKGEKARFKKHDKGVFVAGPCPRPRPRKGA